jgi:hypothetical protein
VDALLAPPVAAYVCAAAIPAGGALLRGLGIPASELKQSERWALAGALGLGVEALLLSLLGFAHVFRPVVVALAPAVLALATLPFALPWLGRPQLRPTLPDGTLRRLALVLSGVLALAVLVFGLGPPTDYDGLLYHLVAPQTYLDAGGVVYIPHNFSANLPMFGEMLFAVGLALGSDRAPQLIHGVAGALAVALTGLLGARLLDGHAGFWGAVALAGTPLVPFLSTRAYIDLFTVVFALVAFWGALAWRRERRDGWLWVAGSAAGFAVATKYAALTAVLPLATGLVLAALARGDPITSRLRAVLRAGALFGGAALVVALPWLVRQVLILGNPVWPMYLGGRDWGPERVEQLTYFVSQYGSGTGLVDWLLLPVSVYWESWRFGHVPLSFPPPIAVAAPAVLLLRRSPARWLLAVMAAVGLLWARGWQDLRYLLTVYPILALLGVLGARALLGRWRHGRAVLEAALCVGLALTCAREGLRALERVPVVLGMESVQAHLERVLSDHRAITYLNKHVPPSQSVLFLGDGQIWYCAMRCIPDPAHDNLLVWLLGRGMARDGATLRGFSGGIDVPAAAARLQAEGVTHVLLSKRDFWYLEHQDPENRLKKQLAEFYVFKARYLDLVYEDALTEVYRGRW